MEQDPGRESNTDHLDAARDRYRMLFENNPLIVWEHDFSRAKTYLDGLDISAATFREYLEANPEELTELFGRVRTIGVNQNAVDYYRADSKEHLLNNVDKLLGDEAWELTVDLWQSVAEGKTQFRGETVAVTFDGERRYQILDMFVPPSHVDTYERVYMTGTDIQDLKEHEHALKRERDRLDGFASLVSHDLRNPLNVAQGRIDLAREVCECEHLEPAARAIAQSLEVVDDMLSLARAGKQVSEMETVRLASVVRACQENIDTASVTIRTEPSPTIRADRSRLIQLMQNLIQNAVEHGGTDCTVTVGSLPDGFYIEDDGGGIPAAERQQIFESGYSSNPEGTGFGLRIVKEITEAHGWQITATDGSKGGTRFAITGVERVV